MDLLHWSYRLHDPDDDRAHNDYGDYLKEYHDV